MATHPKSGATNPKKAAEGVVFIAARRSREGPKDKAIEWDVMIRLVDFVLIEIEEN